MKPEGFIALNHGKILCIPWFGGCYFYSNMTKYFNVIMSTPLGGGHIIFAFSGVRTLGFRSFEGKVFILSLVWVFIGLIACMGLLLMKIGL